MEEIKYFLTGISVIVNNVLKPGQSLWYVGLFVFLVAFILLTAFLVKSVLSRKPESLFHGDNSKIKSFRAYLDGSEKFILWSPRKGFSLAMSQIHSGKLFSLVAKIFFRDLMGWFFVRLKMVVLVIIGAALSVLIIILISFLIGK